MKSISVNTNLDINSYMSVVNEIAEAHYDTEGSYQPHIGMLVAMCSFYDHCVTKSNYDEKIGRVIDDPFAAEELFHDDAFIKAFNDALYIDRVRFDFANAYGDAKAIVESKKNTIDHIAMKVKSIIEKVAKMMTEEELSSMQNIADKFSSGTLDVNAFLETYKDSNWFKELLASGRKAE